MRLIDVSVLKEWVENWFTKNRLYHPYAKNNNIPITELYDILEQMPSASTKGKWLVYEVANTEEEQPIAWECSECGAVVDCKTKFCPECGQEKEV